MAVSPLTISNIRKSVVDFSISWQDVSLSALVRSDASDGPVPTSLDDLLKFNYTFGTIAESSTALSLMSSRDHNINQLWSRIVSKSGMVPDVEEGKLRATRGKYAFIVEKPTAEYESARDCRLDMVGDFLPKEGYAFPLQKGERKLASINAALGVMKSDGAIDRIKKHWWNVPFCSVANSTFQGSRVVVIAGVLATMVARMVVGPYFG